MRAAAKRKNDSGLDEENIYLNNDIRMLKTKAIYGSNASGKSNFAKAIGAFAVLVKRSVAQEKLTKVIWRDRFALISNSNDLPMTFQYIFSIGKNIFRYGFQIFNEDISSEWLFGSESKDLDIETQYFFRQKAELKLNEKYFPSSSSYFEFLKSRTNEIFRSDALFLTSAAISGNEISAIVRDAINRISTIDGTDSDTGLGLALHILDEGTEDEKSSLKKFVKDADTGILDINLIDMPYSPDNVKKLPPELSNNKNATLKSLSSFHLIFNENNKPLKKTHQDDFYRWESKGTVKLLGLAAIILRTLKHGDPLVIDEFDSSLHPNLTLKILNIFNSEVTNPNNAQLIVITHDIGLMRGVKLRRDQIAFVDKDQYGKSSLKTLIEYKKVRKDASYEKEYLDGTYSGVPYLEKLDSSILEFLK